MTKINVNVKLLRFKLKQFKVKPVWMVAHKWTLKHSSKVPCVLQCYHFIHNQHLCTCVQTLNVVMPAAAASGGTTAQTVPAKVLDCDTITQVKEKLLEQTWKGTSFSQRPHIDSLHLGESDSQQHNSFLCFSLLLCEDFNYRDADVFMCEVHKRKQNNCHRVSI